MHYLQNHVILSSTDVDDVRETIKSLSSPHDFDVKGKRAVLDARVMAAQCGDLNLMHSTFGDVRVDLKSREENTDGLLLFLLTSGAGNARHGAQDIEFSVGRGFFRDLAVPMNASEEGFGSFIIPLSKQRLKAHARTLIGDEADPMELAFDPEIDFTAPGGAVVRNTVHYISEILDGPLRELNNPIITTQMEDLLLTQFLTLLPNSYQDFLNGRSVTTVVPYHVKRAREYIYAHADQKLGLADIARAAGCGYRGLQRGFMDAYGVSPMAYLRLVRLKRIRAQLLTGQGGGAISDVAKKWGFTHMGRFAEAYGREFGELPSETLRKRA
ncbi:AraC family transcriptional regulator [Pelagibius litoralis]|uniref:AraC family transcriptional regulator n=1 Tax=Pelagibius litoralis TaxID=374515 RepID=A0A967K9L0_9PROT|nr:helix-turn-helix transcriptional regulator [Pelagibius litoralis]NIA69374.1 AraC family transcriptional regulator [Pelagibius litoralis]